MRLEEILEEGSRLKESGRENWPAPAVGVARKLDAHLADPLSLKAVVSDLISVAQRFGCDAVAGASPLGERLAGAVVASGEHLRLFSLVRPGRCVLVVDGLLTTGSQLSMAMQRCRDAGVLRTPGVVLMAEQEALTSLRGYARDEVVALREF